MAEGSHLGTLSTVVITQPIPLIYLYHQSFGFFYERYPYFILKLLINETRSGKHAYRGSVVAKH